MERVGWRGWSKKRHNFEVCHDEVVIIDVERRALCLRIKGWCSGCDENIKGVVLDMSWEVDMLN